MIEGTLLLVVLLLGLVLAVLAIFTPWFIYRSYILLGQIKETLDETYELQANANDQRAAMLAIWNRPRE